MSSSCQTWEIYWVELLDSNGREIKDTHPALVISNDRQNNASHLIIVLPLTSLKEDEKTFSFQMPITLKRESAILIDQIRTIDRTRFLDKITKIDEELMEQVEKKIHFVLALKS